MSKKLILLDAYALIYRAHFAFIKNPRINSKGLNTSAIFGFCNSLLEVTNKFDPSHIGVVFDPPGGSDREGVFADYKANRQEMPEDIRKAIPHIFDLLKAMNIKVEMEEGFEADDVIGTLAKQAEKKGFETYMMTPDKDFGQLVSDHIFIYKPGRSGNPSEILGPKEVCEKFEVKDPLQVIDILGLWGDAVDNIPGVPGVGEKTAKKLISTYGSIENLIKNTHDLKGKLKENVENFAEQAILSKQLATIILDCPVEFEESEFSRKEVNEKELIKLFQQLEFNQLGKRILGKPIIQEKQMDLFGSMTDAKIEDEKEKLDNIQSVKKNYQLISSRQEHENFIKQLSKQNVVSFDTETTSLKIDEAKLLGISVSFKANEGFYCNLSQDINHEILNLYQPFFKSNSIKIAHNLKFDLGVLYENGIHIEGPIFDTMIAHYLIDAEQRHNLDHLSRTILKYNPIPIEDLIGEKKREQINMSNVPVEKLKDYAAEDADLTYQLYLVFKAKLQSLKLETLFEKVEMPLIEVLFHMERAGININTQELEAFSQVLNQNLNALQETMFQEAGTTFNIDSPKQLGEILFGHLKLDEKAKKTKTGQFKTDEATLIKLKGKTFNY